MSEPRPPRAGALRAALPLALLLAALPAAGAAPRVEVRAVLDAGALGEPRAFDVAPDGAVLVLTGDDVLDVGSGARLFAGALRAPTGLTLGGAGELRLLADGALHAVGAGAPRRVLEVPLVGALLAADGPRTWLAGVDAEGRALLFLHEEGRGHRAVLELDEPVDAMDAAGGALFLSSGQAVYALREGGPARLVARLPGLRRVASLAVDGARGLLYLSDGEALFALRGDHFVLVRPDLGGQLRLRGDELLVLSPHHRALLSVRGLGAALRGTGAVAPWADPCRDPAVGPYCRALAERALLAALPEAAPGQAPALEALAAARRAALAAEEAALAAQAARGVVALAWSPAGPRPLRAGAALAGGARGLMVSRWDGGELRLGAGAAATLGECMPGAACRVSLARGLLHVAAGPAPGAGAARPATHELAVGPLRVALEGAAEVAVARTEALTAVLVLAGRARVDAPGTAAVTVGAGEMLEVGAGAPPGAPAPLALDRINRWWERLE